jgi:peptidoglycan/xylan/chitin deacetylase (PgdA/CDA1 family)
VAPFGESPRYRPSAFLKASAIAHLAVIGGFVVRPDLWPFLAGVMFADQVGLALGGLLPRATLLGPNVSRMPRVSTARGEVALTIDDGPSPGVTPAVLDVLDSHNAQATFFCVGERVHQYPGITLDAANRGHRIENHTWSHPKGFAFLPPAVLAPQIDKAQDAIREITGRQPMYFRAPAGIRSPFLEPILCRRGLRLASWTRRGYDTMTKSPARVISRLVRGLAPGHVLLLHDGPADASKPTDHIILSVLPALLSEIDRRGLKAVSLP